MNFRRRIDLLSLQQSDCFELFDATTKAVVNAVINNEDVFQHALAWQAAELAKTQERTDMVVREMQQRTVTALREEHAITRSGVAEEMRIVRQEIQQLPGAVVQLSTEVAELRSQLSEFTNSTISNQSEMLQWRSNTVSTPSLALKTENVYRILQVSIYHSSSRPTSDDSEQKVIARCSLTRKKR